MVRVLGIPALLVAVAAGLYLSAKGMQSNGPTSDSGQQAITQAQSATAGLNFSQAVPVLQASGTSTRTAPAASPRPAPARGSS